MPVHNKDARDTHLTSIAPVGLHTVSYRRPNPRNGVREHEGLLAPVEERHSELHYLLRAITWAQSCETRQEVSCAADGNALCQYGPVQSEHSRSSSISSSRRPPPPVAAVETVAENCPWQSWTLHRKRVGR
eukprot:1271283-Rhodomonas_salina.1